MSKSVGFSRKAEDAYPTVLLGPCSQFIVESEMLIYFVSKINDFVVYVCFPCLVFVPDLFLNPLIFDIT